MKKVLILTPRSPFKNRGTDEQERVYAVKWFVEHGYEVEVITKVMESDLSTVEEAKQELGIEIITVPYKFRNRKDWFKRLFNPVYWDGASYEYFEPEIQARLTRELDAFKPDVVWIDYVYLWPLCDEVRKRKIPIVMRSLNFEALHVIEEEGFTPLNVLLFFPKLLSEWLASKKSNVVITLNPNEVRWYRWLGANVKLLPLRYLWQAFRDHRVMTDPPYHVLFMGSSYMLTHNVRSFEFVARELAPEMSWRAPGKFIFHITGSKFPEKYKGLVDGKTVVYDGYVPQEKMEEYLASMDFVICPATKRVGMQGKIFEPLARGIPVITPEENMVGFPFKDREDIVYAKTRTEHVRALLDAQDDALRARISRGASARARRLFSREAADRVVEETIMELIS